MKITLYKSIEQIEADLVNLKTGIKFIIDDDIRENQLIKIQELEDLKYNFNINKQKEQWGKMSKN